MNPRTWIKKTIPALGVVLACACGGDGGSETAERTYASSQALVPSWLLPIGTELKCGEAVRGTFTGEGSAHRYALHAEPGYSYTFHFQADYAQEDGAAVALYDATTGARVAGTHERLSNDARVTFSPPRAGEYVVGAYAVRVPTKGSYTLRQVCEVPGINDLVVGQTQFKSYELPGRFITPLEDSSRAVAESAPEGRKAAVEEADIFRIQGDRLYDLNTYRGLLTYDIRETRSPKLVSRLPLHGYPVEMFVEADVVYALIRDVVSVAPRGGTLSFERKNVSQIVAIDVSTPAEPRILKTIDILGELREGVSRKVGSSIYVVSSMSRSYASGWSSSLTPQEQKEQAWVYSFDISSPQSLALVDKLKIFEGGGVDDATTRAQRGRYFGDVHFSATPNTLLVAENWSTYASTPGAPRGCGTSQSLDQAVISIVDISNPNGKIKLHTRFETYGRVTDPFKQSYAVDPRTGKATYIGIFAQRGWRTEGCQGESFVENTVESWDVTTAAATAREDKLTFGEPDELVQGSLFDLDRKTVYAVTARQIDPLYAIAFSDPAKLSISSSIVGLSGQMDVFRFASDDRTFLIGVGPDNSEACTGFDSPSTGFSSRMATSLIDVRDLSKIRLVQRQCVTVEGANFIGSAITWNRDIAHKMIAVHSDALANVVAVPVNYTRKEPDGTGAFDYSLATAVGMTSWDLTRYDDTKDEKHQSVLKHEGTVIHPLGEVRRAAIFAHAATRQRELLSISDTHLQLTNIQDLALPVRDAVVEVTRNDVAVFRFGNYMIEEVRRGGEYGGESRQASDFLVKEMGAGNLEAAPVVARFTVADAERAERVGDALVVFRAVDSRSKEVRARVFDLSVPPSPRRAADVTLPLEYLPYSRYRAGSSSLGIVAPDDGNALVVAGDRIVFLKTVYREGPVMENAQSLVTLDLTSIDDPRVSETPLPKTGEKTTLLGLVADEGADESADATAGDVVFVNAKTTIGKKTIRGTSFDEVANIAQRWVFGAGGWTKDADVSIPGVLIKSFRRAGAPVLLTHDTIFEGAGGTEWKGNSRLNLASNLGTRAAILDTVRFAGQRVRDLALEDGRMFVGLSDAGRYGWPILFRRSGVAASAARSFDSLAMVDVRALDLRIRSMTTMTTGSAELMGVYRNTLLFGIVGTGVLTVDVGGAVPLGKSFLPTLGYANQIEVAGERAFLPEGLHGIRQVHL